MPIVVKHRCPQDHICPTVGICPVEAVTQDGHNAPEIDRNKCIECGACVDFCPHQAITEPSAEKNIRSSLVS